MRSANFAHLLEVYGYKTYTLVKGYKAYRNFVLESFNNDPDILILGGETGSGKTEILLNISKRGQQTIDLEGLANHKGSAFGSLGEQPQPTQEQFENDLSHAFSKTGGTEKIWLEDEARSIGRVQLPNPLWEKMKVATILRISFPKEQRLDRLMNDYGNFSSEELKTCILKIEKRLGPQHTKHALEELEKGNLREVADLTLYPLANSWYIGANIPGKPHVFMPYIGGVGAYAEKCNAVAANGYEGFSLGAGEGVLTKA